MPFIPGMPIMCSWPGICIECAPRSHSVTLTVLEAASAGKVEKAPAVAQARASQIRRVNVMGFTSEKSLARRGQSLMWHAAVRRRLRRVNPTGRRQECDSPGGHTDLPVGRARSLATSQAAVV
jgi:hypothetical protein